MPNSRVPRPLIALASVPATPLAAFLNSSWRPVLSESMVEAGMLVVVMRLLQLGDGLIEALLDLRHLVDDAVGDDQDDADGERDEADDDEQGAQPAREVVLVEPVDHRQERAAQQHREERRDDEHPRRRHERQDRDQQDEGADDDPAPAAGVARPARHGEGLARRGASPPRCRARRARPRRSVASGRPSGAPRVRRTKWRAARLLADLRGDGARAMAEVAVQQQHSIHVERHGDSLTLRPEGGSRTASRRPLIGEAGPAGMAGPASLGCLPVAYCRAMCMRSSASGSWISSPLTSTVTSCSVPVNLNGLG